MSSNGRLASNELTRIYHPTYKVYLENDAAAAFNTLRIWSAKWMKTDLYPTGEISAYRDIAGQNQTWAIYQAGGNLAAYPGTSNHGWGKAIDLATSAMWSIITKFGKKVGWSKIEAFSEPWHFNFVGPYNRPNPGISVKYPIAREGSGGWGQKWFVKKLDRRLRKLGYKSVKVDGEFGSVTKEKVKHFQKNKGLTADGVVGEKTWKALYAANPKDYKRKYL